MMAAMRPPAVRHGGFTWIELLAVIAAIAILGAMTIPGMMEAAVKRQVKDGMALAELGKRGVQSVYSATGKLPDNNADAGAPPPDKIVGNLVRSVAVEKDGAVTITYGNNASKALEGRKLTLRPAIVPGFRAVPIAWLCAGSKVPDKMEARGRDETDIPPKHLPLECR